MVTDIGGGVPLRALVGLRRWRRRRQTIAKRRRANAELHALDDRVLQDIGVDRRAIPELVDAQFQDEAEAAGPRLGSSARPCAQPC